MKLLELKLVDLIEKHQMHSDPLVNEFNTLGIPESIQVTEKLLSVWIKQQELLPRLSYTLGIKLINKNEFVGLIALNLGKAKYRSAEV